MSESLVFLRSLRGNPTVVHDGFEYRRKRENKSTTNWECIRESCNGRLTTDKDRTLVLNKSSHSCTPDDVRIEVKKAVISAKKRAREDTNSSILEIYEGEISGVKDKGLDFVTSVPTFEHVKSSLYRERARANGKKIKTDGYSSDIVIPKDSQKMDDGTRFLIVGDQTGSQDGPKPIRRTLKAGVVPFLHENEEIRVCEDVQASFNTDVTEQGTTDVSKFCQVVLDTCTNAQTTENSKNTEPLKRTAPTTTTLPEEQLFPNLLDLRKLDVPCDSVHEYCILPSNELSNGVDVTRKLTKIGTCLAQTTDKITVELPEWLAFESSHVASVLKQKGSLYSTATTSSDSSPQEPQSTDKRVDAQEAHVQSPQIEELNKTIQELAKQKDELNDKYKRALAEGENMRKRLSKQIEDAKIYGIQSFCKDLLEVADVLSKATECVPKEEIKDSNPHLKNLFEGLSMTEAQLHKVFKRHGLTEVNPLNEKFNPNFHEALFQQEVEGSEPGTVVVVSKIGYKLHERVIRPALVGVSKG